MHRRLLHSFERSLANIICVSPVHYLIASGDVTHDIDLRKAQPSNL
jgi:hypothetical protein